MGLIQWAALGAVLIALTSSSYVEYKTPQRYYHTSRYATSAMDGIESTLRNVHKKLWGALGIVADNKSRINQIFKVLNAAIDYGKHIKENYKLECPVKDGVVDEDRGICLLYRNVQSYGRNWKDARQYCLQKGGDLAQPSVYDPTYDDDLIEDFPELATMEGDIFIGIKAVEIDCSASTRLPASTLFREGRGTAADITLEGEKCYEYRYIGNGLAIPNDHPNFRGSSMGNPDDGKVAALSLAIHSDHGGIEIFDRPETDARGFLCEFELKPTGVPKFKVPQNHIDDSVIIDPEDMIDVEAGPVSSEESDESDEEPVPPPTLPDEEDEVPCDLRCTGLNVCNAVADRCEPENVCSMTEPPVFCGVGYVCNSANFMCEYGCGATNCDASEVCNVATMDCEARDECGNNCSEMENCDASSRICVENEGGGKF